MSVRVRATLGAKAAVRQSIDLKTEIGLVAEASLTCLTALRDRLLASQDIVLEADPMLDEDIDDEDIDDEDIDGEDIDGENDCEFDLGDADVPEEESETEGTSDQESGPGWTRDEGFALRVVPDPAAKGGWLVNVPLSGWEGLVGRTRRGKGCVDAVSTRQLVYLRLAAWLEEKHQEVLAGGPFASVKLLMGQGDLLNTVFDKGDVTASNLSRYLKNVDLSWPQGSIPVRKLFAD